MTAIFVPETQFIGIVISANQLCRLTKSRTIFVKPRLLPWTILQLPQLTVFRWVNGDVI